MIEKMKHVISISIIATFGFFGLASFLPMTSMWGFNHLGFLPSIYTYTYIFVSALLLFILIVPFSDNKLHKTIIKIDSRLFGKNPLPRFVIVTVFGVLFILNMSDVHLLGDGYAWLGNFGSGEAYLLKWAEPLSSFLIRQIQYLLGGYNYNTALATFRMISIFSGLIFVYNIIVIVGSLCTNSHTRLWGLSTIIFSGGMLLFFGYVEFYALVWASSAIIFNLSIKNLNKEYPLWPIILIYILSILLHIQMICLLPGIIYLVIRNIKPVRIRKLGYKLMTLGAVAGIIAVIYLYNTKIEFEVLILPFLEGRPVAPKYTFFSVLHLIDLTNLVLLLFPGIISLLTIWLLYANKSLDNPLPVFLCFLSLGSLSFTFLYGAAITMGRDWDILSLGLLPPIFLLLYQIGRNENYKHAKQLSGYVLIIVFMATSFILTNTNSMSAEKRFKTLLNDRNANVWATYANYYLMKKNKIEFRKIVEQRYSTFPELRLLDQAYECIENGNYSRAGKIAINLVKRDQYNPDFLQIMGNVLFKTGNYNDAEPYFVNAMKLKPYNYSVLNEIGQLYIKQGKYDKAIDVLNKAHKLEPDTTYIIETLALAYIHNNEYDKANLLAEALFLKDSHSPGASLIKLTIASRQGDWQTARIYYLEFVKHGKGRSDYETMIDYYKNLQ